MKQQRHELTSSMDMDDTGPSPHQRHLPHSSGGVLPALPSSTSGSSFSSSSSFSPCFDADREYGKAKEASPSSPSSSPCSSPFLEHHQHNNSSLVGSPYHPLLSHPYNQHPVQQQPYQQQPPLPQPLHQQQQQQQHMLQFQGGRGVVSRETDLEESRALFNQLQHTLARQFEFLQQERASLAKERAMIDQKRQAFEEVKKTMTNVLQLQESRVRLNVGGCKFTTSLDTLLIYPDSMLGSMFSGKFKLEKDEKGYFFIDRDGTHFRYILNFLRSGTLLMPEDPVVKRELLVEAEFYQIRPLIDLILHGPQTEVKFSHDLVHKNITLDSTRTIATVSTKGTCRLLLDTHSVSEGKNFWEFRLDKLQNPNCIALGVTRTTGNLSAYVGSSKDGWSLIVMNRENMKKWNSPTCEEYGKGVFKEGDTVGILLDYTNGDRGTLSFYLNGVNQGEAFRNLPPHLFPTISLHSKGDQVSLLPSRLPEDA